MSECGRCADADNYNRLLHAEFKDRQDLLVAKLIKALQIVLSVCTSYETTW